MQLKAILATLALVALPAVAMADCSWHNTNQSASQCPQGQTFDSTAGSCVPQTTS
ncbi:hypothetical protein [Tropicimonas sp. IMCC34043]|uniref:hypothetical protein n=1 Tax=Tropicimonas sp. IMCC34043 TaxID=2248760 RepID=UPI0018E505B2|nr:hypothetical protein [Tropicimonas sp. IMCC34043]